MIKQSGCKERNWERFPLLAWGGFVDFSAVVVVNDVLRVLGVNEVVDVT